MEISSREQACKILGVPTNADKKIWKSAYRSICKSCHPDVAGQYADKEKRIILYESATAAVDYLEKNTETTGRVIGTPVTRDVRANDSVSRADYKKIHAENKNRQYEELKKKAEEIHRKERENKQKEIEDKIRWLRVTQIINDILNT